MRNLWSDLQPHLRRMEAEATPHANTDSTVGQANYVRPLTPQNTRGEAVQLAASFCECGSAIPAARMAALVRLGLTLRCRDCAEARPGLPPTVDDLDLRESAIVLREVARRW
ncbi:MAG: hypothetical protein ABFD60_13090 [Bryobacteraceae bacterium]